MGQHTNIIAKISKPITIPAISRGQSGSVMGR